VPLYKVFCQATGFGGTTQRVAEEDAADRIARLTPVPGGRILRVTFDAQAGGGPNSHDISVSSYHRDRHTRALRGGRRARATPWRGVGGRGTDGAGAARRRRVREERHGSLQTRARA